MTFRIQVGERAELSAPGRTLADLGLAEVDEVDAAGALGVAVFAREGVEPFLAGDLRALSVADVLTAVYTGRRDGVGVFFLEGGRRMLRFEEGEVVFASSTFESDRLGEVLRRQGLIDRETLEDAGREVGRDKRLGDVLVERGVLSSAQLYQGLTEQVRHIVLSLFHHRAGRFVVVERPSAAPTRLRLEESTRDLILAGIRQLDDAARFREAVPDDAVFEPRPPAPGVQLTDDEREMLALADGVSSAGELVAASGLGAYEGLRVLAHMVEARLLVPQTGVTASAARIAQATAPPPPQPAPPETRSASDAPEVPDALDAGEPPAAPGEAVAAGPFEAYARAIARIHGILAKANARPEALQSYLEEAPASYAPLFEGVRLDETGRLDVARLLSNARTVHGDHFKGRALEALDAFESFALFQARNVLPPEVAAKLQRLVMLIQLGKA